MDNDIMTIDEVAQFLRISKEQVYKLGKQAQHPLPMIRVGRQTKRVNRKALNTWLEEREEL